MSDQMLNRRDVVRAVLSNRGEDLLVITGLGQPCYDAMAAGDDPRNFYLWGAMGGAVAMGIGLAVAQPQKRAVVITGDGEALMGVGALATVAAQAKRLGNLAIVVLDNERYGETGQQETHTAHGTDLAGMARAAGFREVAVATDDAGLAAAVRMVRETPGPVMVVIKVSPDPVPLVIPPKDGQYLKTRFREAVLGDPGV